MSKFISNKLANKSLIYYIYIITHDVVRHYSPVSDCSTVRADMNYSGTACKHNTVCVCVTVRPGNN